MIGQATVQPMLPVKDLEAAKKFYEEKLGLKRVGEMPRVALTYQSGSSTLCVYHSKFAGTNKGTAALWEVEDVDGTVKALGAKGVPFEHYDDMPDVKREGDVHVAGDMRIAWFKDPSDNILSIQNRPASAGRR